jgi:DNA modification methylase
MMETNRIINGCCLDVLKTLPYCSVNCCITSPPYYGLRDYGVDGQIGLEETPEEYVQKLVAVFHEVRRVLKDDGTLWLNLGDSYAGSGKGSNPDGTPHPSTLLGKQGTNTGTVTGLNKPQKANTIGLKPKDLIGIPWMVAFALRADGWYLRQDIIWHKPNPMPESVKDRCTKAHEYVFLMSKSKKYYYDIEPIREPIKDSCDGTIRALARDKGGPVDIGSGATMQERVFNEVKGANKRSVWTVNTAPCKEAHFATFPKKLIEPMILAGCPKDGVVLDPFIGSGTTGMVAVSLQRKYVGIELNKKYCEEIASKRTTGVQQQIFV